MGYGNGRTEERGLLSRTRSFSGSSEDIDLDAIEDAVARTPTTPSRPPWLTSTFRRPRNNSIVQKARNRYFSRARRRRSLLARCCHYLSFIPHVVVCLALVYGIFFPSYSNPPPRYTELRSRVLQSNTTGAANVDNEKIFIAASLYDKEGELLAGHWGQAVRRLIDILGHENVFLSIYENDPDESNKRVLDETRQTLPCNASIAYEHLDIAALPHVVMPDGTSRLRRISFLAEVRNRALRPLYDERSSAYDIRWDKLLYLNDVAFDPVDAANLLLNTNVDEKTGRSDYRAACAVDFINPFKFYDTFATRDLEGYDMGVPFYPWFTTAGNATSRQDVLAQREAVRVKSCWSGMVAFEAKWFQPRLYAAFEGNTISTLDQASRSDSADANGRISNQGHRDPDGADFDRKFSFHPDPRTPSTPPTASPADLSIVPPLQFRAETDTYWDASECCLIHADLAELSSPTTNPTNSAEVGTGIYMNPFIRVAYTPRTLAWLPYTSRLERLYSLVHRLVNAIGRRPGFNPRRLEAPGEEVVDRVWRWDERSLEAIRNGTAADLAGGLHGSFEEVRRVATPGQFCGGRRMLFLREEGDGWGNVEVPPSIVV